MSKSKLLKIFKLFLPYGLILFLKKYKQYQEKTKNKKQKEYTFDIIVSIGISCRPTYYLNKHKLRFYASPLDWVGSYPLNTVYDLYNCKFDDFFINYSEHKENSNWFLDNKYNIRAMHYPEIGKDNLAFNKKMKKRFNKLNKQLIKANKICFISNRDESNVTFFDFLKKMSTLYSADITLINLKNNSEIDSATKPIIIQKEKISKNLNFIQYEFKDIHPNGDDKIKNSNFWLGNIQIWDDILNKISINNNMNFLSFLIKTNKK